MRMPASRLLAVLILTTLFPVPQAHSQSYTTLYSFRCGTDGAAPQDGVVQDLARNLYGTSGSGGSSGNGVVFKLAPDGAEMVLHSFAGPPGDGANPDGNLILDGAGNVYGVTQYGGSAGFGVVFRVTPSGQESVLHSFTGGLDGSGAIGGLARDAQGNLYGVTYAGGSHQFGVVFKLSPGGRETVLHAFASGPEDGAYPDGGLIRDASGNLYGTTSRGGANNAGTVFEITPGGSEILLHSFAGSTTDGAYPGGGHLLRDAMGSLYSAAYDGGNVGDGIAFKVSPSGGETVLFNFGVTDGEFPNEGLAEDSSGNLYGTTSNGGSLSCGCGVLYRLTPSGQEFVLHAFSGIGDDGANPNGDLIRDAAGNLDGTAAAGGSGGCGVVFAVKP